MSETAVLVSSATEAPPVAGQPQAAPATPPQEAAAACAAAQPAAKTPDKPAYLPPPTLPVMEGPHGIRYDFNLGARVHVPERKDGTWRVILRDLDTGNILFRHEAAGATITSSKRYYTLRD